MAVRGVVTGIVVLGVVAVGAYAADEFARSSAEDQAVIVLEQQLEVDGRPDVRIDGFPFLVQYLAGSLDDVHATADGVVLDGVRVTDVAVALADVSLDAPHRVGDVRVEGTVPTSSIQQVVGERTSLDVTVDGEVLRASGDLFGIRITAGLVPRVQDGELLVDVQEVTLGAGTLALDELPGGIGDRLVGMRVPLEGLPEGVVLQDAVVVPDGVRFTATGTDVVVEELP